MDKENVWGSILVNSRCKKKKKKKFIQLNVLLLGSAEGRNHSPYNALSASVCPLVSLCMFASASLF